MAAPAVLVGRTMDWPESTEPILTVLPRGLAHDGGKLGERQPSRIPIRRSGRRNTAASSRSVYGLGAADGINERASPRTCSISTRPISARATPAVAGLAGRALGAIRCSTTPRGVAEALALLDKGPADDGRSRTATRPTVHLALEDASGDSAIIEYIDGKPVVHHGREFRVMTNDPSYDQQLELLKGQDFSKPSSDMPLPGNVNPRDRFQRASYYLSMVPTPKSEREGVAGMLAIMRNVSVPFGAPYKGFGVYNTEYRTVSDTTNKIYFFELTTSPNVDLDGPQGAGLPPRRAGARPRSGFDRPQRRRIGFLRRAPAPF